MARSLLVGNPLGLHGSSLIVPPTLLAPNGRPLVTRRRSSAAAVVGVTHELLDQQYNNPLGAHPHFFDIKWRTGVGPRPIIVPVHAGGWHETPPTKDANGVQGAYNRLFDLGWNVAKPSYWGSEDAAGYNRTRPWQDIQDFLAYLVANAATYNILSTSIHLLLQSAGGEIGLMALIRGANVLVKSATIWSGAVVITDCNGTSAAGDAQAHVGSAYPTNWNLCVPGLVATGPLLGQGGGQIFLRFVWSHDEDTITFKGINRSQPLTCISQFTGLGHTNIEQREYSVANGDSVTNRHYNFAGPDYGGEAATDDVPTMHARLVAQGFQTW